MGVESKRKGNIPLFYLVTALCIIAYSCIVNYILFISQDPIFMLGLKKLDNSVTYAWIIYNIFFLVFSFIKKYKWKLSAFCGYYIIIYGFNILNYNLHWYPNYDLLFGLNMLLRLFEVVFIVYLLTKKEFS